jgi:hypothetical protein
LHAILPRFVTNDIDTKSRKKYELFSFIMNKIVWFII